MKKFILISLALLMAVNLFAQDDGFYGPSEEAKKITKKDIRRKKLEKWSFGGNLSLGFSSSNSYVDLSPIAFYKLTPRLNVGAGFTYIYYAFNNQYLKNVSIVTPTDTIITTDVLTKRVSGNFYGPRAAVQFILFSDLYEKINVNIGNIILTAEYSYLNTDQLWYDPTTNEISKGDNIWFNSLLVGGGIYQPFGGRGGLSITILYDVFEHDSSPYDNPTIRLGLFF